MQMNSTIDNPTEDFHAVEFPIAGAKAYVINARITEDDIQEVFDRVTAQMAAQQATIVSQYLFGGRQYRTRIFSAVGRLDWPLVLLQCDTCPSTTLTGTQFIAFSGADLHPVMDGDRQVGSWFETDDARYCLLCDIRADDLSQTREAQTQAVFEKMEDLLIANGMFFTDTVRTWIYLKDLLQWYEGFNEVRTRFFRERGVFENLVPASTGIGASSIAGEAIVAALLAVKPKHDGVKVFPVPSPLQCSALDYKSAFSRAVEIQLPGSRLLTVSGTASIEAGGQTAHVGDTARQIDLTMKIVQEILKSRRMGWRDTVRAIAYFKDITEAYLLEKYCIEHDLPDLPLAIVHADVCRDDLLFEIEVDAVTTGQGDD